MYGRALAFRLPRESHAAEVNLLPLREPRAENRLGGVPAATVSGAGRALRPSRPRTKATFIAAPQHLAVAGGAMAQCTTFWLSSFSSGGSVRLHRFLRPSFTPGLSVTCWPPLAPAPVAGSPRNRDTASG